VLKARLGAIGKRILVTPHIAGFTHESLEKAENYITRIFIEALNDQG
jgi:phosphoglycerate dehydrogenase-like enzyme